MQGRTVWTARLVFWDVPAALLGCALAGVLHGVIVGGYSVLWVGAPVAFVLARRALLPQLSPSLPDNPRPKVSAARKVGAYLCMIFGGFIALMSGLLLYAAATDASKPEFSWPVFVVASGGAILAALGVRWLT